MSDSKIPVEIITHGEFEDKQWAINHAQIKANLTGERWYVIALVSNLMPIFIVCSEEEGADKYWGRPRHICYPLNPSRNRQQGTVFGGMKVKTTHK